jgi:hypothetical protein
LSYNNKHEDRKLFLKLSPAEVQPARLPEAMLWRRKLRKSGESFLMLLRPFSVMLDRLDNQRALGNHAVVPCRMASFAPRFWATDSIFIKGFADGI